VKPEGGVEGIEELCIKLRSFGSLVCEDCGHDSFDHDDGCHTSLRRVEMPCGQHGADCKHTHTYTADYCDCKASEFDIREKVALAAADSLTSMSARLREAEREIVELKGDVEFYSNRVVTLAKGGEIIIAQKEQAESRLRLVSALEQKWRAMQPAPGNEYENFDYPECADELRAALEETK
jgi:hypothetical protein